ncbi:MAG: hypothetical protein ACXWU0_04565, partial [Rhodoplanes sp.]
RDQFLTGRLAFRFANHSILESETASAVERILSQFKSRSPNLGSNDVSKNLRSNVMSAHSFNANIASGMHEV